MDAFRRHGDGERISDETGMKGCVAAMRALLFQLAGAYPDSIPTAASQQHAKVGDVCLWAPRTTTCDAGPTRTVFRDGLDASYGWVGKSPSASAV